MLLLPILVAAAVTASSPVPSAAPSAEPSTIGTVRVSTGTAQALHTSPLTAKALDAGAFRTAIGSADAQLRQLPGFDRIRANATFSNYGLNRLSIGGAGNDRGGLLIDGVPGLDPFGGQIDWAAVPSLVLQRAELFLGPGSALYGSGAIGGLLSLRTFGAADVAAQPTFTSFSTVSGLSTDEAVLVGVPAGSWKIGAWADTSRTTFGALAPGYTYSGGTAATTVTGSARATARYQRGDTTLDLGLQSATDAQNQGRPNYSFSRNMNQADLALSFGRGATSATVRGFVRGFDLINIADTFPSKPGTLLYTQSVPSSDAGLSLDVAQALPGGNLLLRAETRASHGASTQLSATGALQNGGAGTVRDNGLAFEYEARAGKLRLLAGARVDDVATHAAIVGGDAIARDDAAVSPRAAFAWAFDPAVTLRIYGGSGLRAPFLNELVRGYRIGTIAYQPNLALVPERSRSGGIGIDLASAGMRATLDVQSTTVVNAIGFRTVSPTAQVRSNVGETRTDAVIASVQRPLRCGAVDLAASMENARVSADVDAILVGKRVPYVPSTSISAGWSGGRRLVGAARVSYLGTSFADDRNSTPLGAATVVDVSVSRPFGWGALTLGVSNASDARYLSSPDRLAPPSNLWLRVRLGRDGAGARGCGTYAA